MIPPNTNELKMHSHDLAQFGRNLRTIRLSHGPAGAVAVVLIALIITVPAMYSIFGA